MSKKSKYEKRSGKKPHRPSELIFATLTEGGASVDPKSSAAQSTNAHVREVTTDIISHDRRFVFRF